jgi:hypothetical protein
MLSLTCNQIWFRLFMKDHQPTYITKFFLKILLSSFCYTILKFQIYRNLSLGFMTKAKGLRRYGPSVKVGSHISCSRECERMNPHTPKWARTLWNWIPNGLPNFQKAISIVKTHWIEEFLTSLESFWNLNF